MYIGKKICKTLKDVRLQVARANDIPYEPAVCHHEGDCLGTCPKCDEELRYITEQLRWRSAMGKAVTVVGLSLGLMPLASCQSGIFGHQVNGMLEPPPELDGDIAPRVDSIAPANTQGADTTQKKMSKAATAVVQGDTAEQCVTLGMMPETQPTFPGGSKALLEWIDSNLQMPDECAQGRVIVSFRVEKDGSITGGKIEKSLSEGCDKEALRLVKMMPKWTPGSFNGERKAMTYMLPISFMSK